MKMQRHLNILSKLRVILKADFFKRRSKLQLLLSENDVNIDVWQFLFAVNQKQDQLMFECFVELIIPMKLEQMKVCVAFAFESCQ